MAQQYGPKIVTDGLVLSLDAADKNSYPGSGTTWTDLSGKGDDGVIYGATFSTTDGGALTFDASDDYVTTGFGLNRNPSTNPFSVSCVVQSNSTASSRMFFAPTSHGADRCYFATNGGYWRMGIQNSSWSGGNIVVTTDPTHITVVLDGSNANMYVNGVYNYSKSYTSYTIPTVFNIGRGNGFYWGSNIFTTHIYDKALSAKEVWQNFNAQRSRFGV